MKFSMLKRTFYSVRKTRALSSPAQPEEIELRTSGQNNMPKKTKELLVGQRHAAFLILANHIDPSSKSGVEWGELSRVAKIFDVDRSAICRFWRDARARMEKENRSLDDVTKDQTFFQPRQHERVRKKKYNRKQLRREVKQLRFKQRRNLRALSVATGVPQRLYIG